MRNRGAASASARSPGGGAPALLVSSLGIVQVDRLAIAREEVRDRRCDPVPVGQPGLGERVALELLAAPLDRVQEHLDRHRLGVAIEQRMDGDWLVLTMRNKYQAPRGSAE